MTTPEAHRCAKCNKWIASYHLPTLDGWTRRCAMCLTPDERMKIDQQAALADKWDQKYAEALAEGDESNG